MATRDEAEATYANLRSYRDELANIVRNRSVVGVAEDNSEELGETEMELRRRLGDYTSSLVDAEAQGGARLSHAQDEDCGWDEVDEDLVAVNLLNLQEPEPTESSGEESHMSPIEEAHSDDDDAVTGLEFSFGLWPRPYAFTWGHWPHHFFQPAHHLFDDVGDGIVIEEVPEFENDSTGEDGIDPDARQAMEVTVGGWPSVVIQEEGYRCLYCQEDIEVGTEGTNLPHCTHIFHMDCIVDWLTPRRSGTQHSLCPTCRQPVYTPPPSPATGGVAHHGDDDNGTRAPMEILIEADPLMQFLPDADDGIAIEEIPEFDEELEDVEDLIDPNELQVMELTVGGWPPAVIPEEGYLCVYCQEDIEVGTEGTNLPHCQHIFHHHCIVHWLARRRSGTQHRTCPTCRQSVYSPPPPPA